VRLLSSTALPWQWEYDCRSPPQPDLQPALNSQVPGTFQMIDRPETDKYIDTNCFSLFVGQGTELIYPSFSFAPSYWGNILHKGQRLRRFNNRIGVKLDRITLLLVNTHRTTVRESNFWYAVILSRWRPWRPPAARCCSVRPLARRVRATSLGLYKRYSSGSIAYS